MATTKITITGPVFDGTASQACAELTDTLASEIAVVGVTWIKLDTQRMVKSGRETGAAADGRAAGGLRVAVGHHRGDAQGQGLVAVAGRRQPAQPVDGLQAATNPSAAPGCGCGSRRSRTRSSSSTRSPSGWGRPDARPGDIEGAVQRADVNRQAAEPVRRRQRPRAVEHAGRGALLLGHPRPAADVRGVLRAELDIRRDHVHDPGLGARGEQARPTRPTRRSSPRWRR